MINVEILNQSGIHYAAGMERFMNNAELYEAVLTAFTEEDIPERAAAAYAAKDNAALSRIAHEAKGSVGNVGFDNLYTEASALVVLLRSASYTEDELTECYNRFMETYAAVKSGVKAALGL